MIQDKKYLLYRTVFAFPKNARLKKKDKNEKICITKKQGV